MTLSLHSRPRLSAPASFDDRGLLQGLHGLVERARHGVALCNRLRQRSLDGLGRQAAELNLHLARKVCRKPGWTTGANGRHTV